MWRWSFDPRKIYFGILYLSFLHAGAIQEYPDVQSRIIRQKLENDSGAVAHDTDLSNIRSSLSLVLIFSSSSSFIQSHLSSLVGFNSLNTDYSGQLLHLPWHQLLHTPPMASGLPLTSSPMLLFISGRMEFFCIFSSPRRFCRVWHLVSTA